MNLLAKLFRNEDAVQRAATVVSDTQAPGISYDGELVRDLVADHHKLAAFRNDIEGALAGGRLSTIPELLAEWKLALQAHIMVENVRFYTYLQQHLAEDPGTSAFLSDLRHEMDGIARTLVKFANTYNNVDALIKVGAAHFRADLAEMTTRLGKRLQVEESRLYTLYIRY
jgi:hypothetical protein